MTTLNMKDGDFSNHYSAPNYVLYSYEKLVEEAMDNVCKELKNTLDNTSSNLSVSSIWWRIYNSLNIRVNIIFNTEKLTPDQEKISEYIVIDILKEVAGEGVKVQHTKIGFGHAYIIMLGTLESTEKLRDKFYQELSEGIENTHFDFPEGEEQTYKKEVFVRLMH